MKQWRPDLTPSHLLSHRYVKAQISASDFVLLIAFLLWAHDGHSYKLAMPFSCFSVADMLYRCKLVQCLDKVLRPGRLINLPRFRINSHSSVWSPKYGADPWLELKRRYVCCRREQNFWVVWADKCNGDRGPHHDASGLQKQKTQWIQLVGTGHLDWLCAQGEAAN